MSKVAIVSCPDYEMDNARKALKEALGAIGGLDFVKEGMRIVVKANLVTVMRPEAAATTHPNLLYALCEMLIAKGAEVIVGDSPGGLYSSAYVNGVYAATGLKKLTETGAKLNQDFSHEHAVYEEAVMLKDFEYTSYLKKADAIINFCKLKTHGMMSLSACVKNMFGAIPGIYKPEYHYRFPEHSRFANMLVDLNEYFPPKLVIVDAVIGMEGNGPTMGTPRKIGAVLASDSPYACDRVCAKLIGLDEKEVETIQAAQERGLNDEITMYGDAEPFVVPDFELVRTKRDTDFYRDGQNIFSRLAGRILRASLSSFPNVQKKKCVGCKKCQNVCPAHAIQMKNNKPAIDRKVCIRCFCCQEFCPVGAMRVKRPLIAKWFNR